MNAHKPTLSSFRPETPWKREGTLIYCLAQISTPVRRASSLTEENAVTVDVRAHKRHASDEQIEEIAIHVQESLNRAFPPTDPETRESSEDPRNNNSLLYFYGIVSSSAQTDPQTGQTTFLLQGADLPVRILDTIDRANLPDLLQPGAGVEILGTIHNGQIQASHFHGRPCQPPRSPSTRHQGRDSRDHPQR